jgi:hypothetical protein
MRMIAREAARAQRARQQAAAHTAARQYLASRTEEAGELTQNIQEQDRAIEGLLARGLAKNPTIDLLATRRRFLPGKFDETRWALFAPVLGTYLPAAPGFFGRMVPGAVRRHERRTADSKRRFDEANDRYAKDLARRNVALGTFKAEEEAREAEIERHNADVQEAKRALLAAEYPAVISYFALVMEKSLDGEPDATSAEVGYSPESRHLVVDLELPEFSAVPEESNFRYLKPGDRVEPVLRPLAKRKALYSKPAKPSRAEMHRYGIPCFT